MTAGRKINNQNKEWCTPKKYITIINDFFDIDLDPCSSYDSIVPAKTKYILPIDGLKESWNFKNIYVNPPYGRDIIRHTSIKDWIRRCLFANQNYDSQVLALIPVATNTSHWKEYIFGKTSICFLYDTRLKFIINGTDINKGAPMACAMVYWGEHKNRFKEIFSEYGFIFII